MDVRADFFHTLHDVKVADFELSGNAGDVAVDSRLSKTRPFVLHGNGNGIETFHALSARLAARGWPNTEATTQKPFRATSSPLKI